MNKQMEMGKTMFEVMKETGVLQCYIPPEERSGKTGSQPGRRIDWS